MMYGMPPSPIEKKATSPYLRVLAVILLILYGIAGLLMIWSGVLIVSMFNDSGAPQAAINPVGLLIGLVASIPIWAFFIGGLVAYLKRHYRTTCMILGIPALVALLGLVSISVSFVHNSPALQGGLSF